MRRFFRSAAFPILIVVVLAFFAQRLISPGSGHETPDYTTFVQRVNSGQIEQVTWNTKDNTLNVKQKDGTSYDEAYPDSDSSQAQLLNSLEQNNVKTEIKGKGGSSLLSLLTYILPFLLFFAFWIFLMNQMQGGGSRVMSFGKSRAKRMSVDAPKITFRDVAGTDEAVQELHADQGVPRESEEVPVDLAPHSEGRAALRHPPAPERRCSPARSPVRPAFPSSRSRAPTSSRCSSASAPLASATSSSRPSRTPLHHLHGPRSTPSAATAGLASAAGTTSASRP